MINCALCGEFLTSPVFVKGKPYGFTCAGKVNWDGVRYRLHGKWVKAESFIRKDINDRSYQIVAIYNGRKYKSNFLLVEQNSEIFFRSFPDTMEYDGINIYINLIHYKLNR
jgi:uncharacterized UPF0160 family protein